MSKMFRKECPFKYETFSDANEIKHTLLLVKYLADDTKFTIEIITLFEIDSGLE
jgi:hypothetical protein